ncbi:MAG: PilZ domain-containing protein [Methylococcales bacterium]
MPDQHNHENRRFHRISFKAGAQLSCAEQTWPCEIHDLSLNGCLLYFASSWDATLDNIYTLTLQLSEEVHISMEVRVSHVIDNYVGFKCVHIDFDSISELRRLVELNLGDSSLLERDLQALSAS